MVLVYYLVDLGVSKTRALRLTPHISGAANGNGRMIRSALRRPAACACWAAPHVARNVDEQLGFGNMCHPPAQPTIGLNSDEHLLIARLSVGSLGLNRLEVEFALALLVEHAITSGAAAAHVHPVGRHHHDRTRAEISG
jgi:hypothetical protein